jgi:hypothetical protein
MPNYGDVMLELPPDWSRSRIGGAPAFMNTAVGHEGGVADAYLTDKPEVLHQFRWCAPEDRTAMDTLRTAHYVLCKKSEWTKNPNLWEWDGDGHILHNGQRLMARDKMWFDREKEETARLDKERDIKRSASMEEEQSMRRVEAQGGIIEDERGRQLRPLSKEKQSKW